MNAFPNQHKQPGRRFAKGATMDDIILGAFGFVSHFFLFMFLGALAAYFFSDGNQQISILNQAFLWLTGITALILLVIRGIQVRATTTKESIEAIKEAFN